MLRDAFDDHHNDVVRLSNDVAEAAFDEVVAELLGHGACLEDHLGDVAGVDAGGAVVG